MFFFVGSLCLAQFIRFLCWFHFDLWSFLDLRMNIPVPGPWKKGCQMGKGVPLSSTPLGFKNTTPCWMYMVCFFLTILTPYHFQISIRSVRFLFPAAIFLPLGKLRRLAAWPKPRSSGGRYEQFEGVSHRPHHTGVEGGKFRCVLGRHSWGRWFHGWFFHMFFREDQRTFQCDSTWHVFLDFSETFF